MTLKIQKTECPHCGADTGNLNGKIHFHCEYCGRNFAVREIHDQEVIVHSSIQIESPFMKSPYSEILYDFVRMQDMRLGFKKNTNYRLLRPADLIHLHLEDYTTTFKAGAWTCLFNQTSPHIIKVSCAILMVGWFCNIDLGGSTLRALVNGVVRNSTPAAFVYPVRQYLTPNEIVIAIENDTFSLEVFNALSEDIKGVVLPVAMFVGPAYMLGIQPNPRLFSEPYEIK